VPHFSRITRREPVPAGAAPTPGNSGDSPPEEAIRQAIVGARTAVAEYLRDLGLRDPDAIAAVSLRIVDQSLHEARSSAEIDPAVLCERAIRLTVRQLEKLLTMVAEQSGNPDESEGLGCAVAARLPSLLNRFPEAFSEDNLPDEFVGLVRERVAPVVPPPRPHPMGRQGLVLVPVVLRRAFHSIRNFMLDQKW
jgi:hypothetical protein